MSQDDTSDPTDDSAEEGVPIEVNTDPEREAETESGGPRKRLEEEADKAVTELDTRLIDILSWVLDTETRGRIYVYLRKHAWSTSEEVAEGTGLYPSTVREALAELADEDIVERRKRESEGAGNNPYEYMAIPPSDLVGNVVGRVQEELNTLFNMESYLGDEDAHAEEPVRIEVADAAEGEETAESADVASAEGMFEEDETGEGTGSDTEATEGDEADEDDEK